MVGGGYGMVTQMRLSIQASAVGGRIAGRTEKPEETRQPNAHHISYQQAAVTSNALQVTAHRLVTRRPSCWPEMRRRR
jgi:hypothetical protein